MKNNQFLIMRDVRVRKMKILCYMEKENAKDLCNLPHLQMSKEHVPSWMGILIWGLNDLWSAL